jgi:hypothetical protein
MNQEEHPEATTPNKGSLTIIHKEGDVIDRTIGRIGALTNYLLLGTPRAAFQDIPKERKEVLEEKFRDVKWQGNVEVYLNHNPLFRQLKRMLERERRTNFFVRVLYMGEMIGAWMESKLFRADYYNPLAESVTTYHPNIAVGMHEIGHAMDFDQSRHPTIRTFLTMPFVNAKLEWNASRNAMKHLNPAERQEAKKVLEPAWGTYLGASVAAIPALLFPPGAPIIILSGVIGGLLLGHLHARLPIRHNIFFNEKPVEEAATYQAAPQPQLALAHARS